MGTKSVWAVGLCLVLAGTTGEALRVVEAPRGQINVPNINPDIERHFEQLRQQEAQARLHKENSEDAQKILFLAAELKRYADSAEDGPVPKDAVRKAKEVEKLAKRVNYRLRESALKIRVH